MKYWMVIVMGLFFAANATGQTELVWQQEGIGLVAPESAILTEMNDTELVATSDLLNIQLINIDPDSWTDGWSVDDYLGALEGKASRIRTIELSDYYSKYRIQREKKAKTWVQVLTIPDSNNRYLALLTYRKCKGKKAAKKVARSFYLVD